MKISCEIIKDLLPLYAEDLASADTVVLVAEHISSCESCKEELAKIKSPDPIPSNTDVAPLKKIRSALRKQRTVTICLSALVALVVAITVFGFLTSPSYIPYSSDIVTVAEQENGIVTVQFGSPVSAYDINKCVPEDGLHEKGFYYHITAWDSIWNQCFKKSEPQVVILNPDGSNVERVYYYQNNGEEDVIIYGQRPSGGVITLPRLVLSYYLVLAFVGAVICGVVIMLTRKNKRIQRIMMNVLFVPVAYIIAHFCIKGIIPLSYSAQRDFFLIILLTMPIYGFLWLLFNRKKRQKTGR
jgi:cbb3-type cytochrome oxidase subunit 3